MKVLLKKVRVTSLKRKNDTIRINFIIEQIALKSERG